MLHSSLLLLGYFHCALARVVPATTRSLHRRGEGDFSLPIRSVKRNNQKRDVSAPVPAGSTLYTSASFGSPTQLLNVLVDTGSPYLWCYDTYLRADQRDGVTTVYNPNVSTTANTSAGLGSFNPTYMDGSQVTGYLITEQISIDGMIVPNFPLGLPTRTSLSRSGDNWDDSLSCLMGLTSHNANDGTYTFFDAVQSQLSNPLFTASLSYRRAGSLNFGSIDAAQYSGNYQDIHYTPITRHPWSITTSSLQIGTNNSASSYSIALKVDTGSSLICLPQQIVEWYIGNITGASPILNRDKPYRYSVPCEAAMPDLYFGFPKGGGVKLVGETMKLYTSTGGCVSLVDWEEERLSGGNYILGAPVFLSNLVVFWNEDPQPAVGFATSREYL